MNTKIKSFAVVMSVAGLVLAGAASAALVNYLSNYVTTSATIASPVAMNVNLGRDGSVNTNKSIALDTVGGSNFVFTTVAKNNANDVITGGYRVIVLEAEEGKYFTGGEVEKIAMEWGNNTMTRDEGDITSSLKVVVDAAGTLVPLSSWTGSSKKLVITNGAPTNLAGGDIEWNALTVKANKAIMPGVYNIYSEFVVDLGVYAKLQYGL